MVNILSRHVVEKRRKVMRFLKWVLGLFFILVVSIILIFEFINWNQYKSLVISKVKETTNRNLLINGNLKIRLIPTPHLIVNDVSLSNAPGATDKNMIDVKEVKISVSLLPLLSRRVQFSTIYLDTPVIHLEKTKNAKPNWEFKPLENEISQTPKTDEAHTFLKSEPAFNLEINNGKISNGTITYQDGTSLTTVSDMDLNFEIDGTKGPYALGGKLFINKIIPISFSLKTDKLTEKGLNLNLTLHQADTNVNFKGLLKPDTLTLTGSLTGDGQFKNDRIKGDKATLKADIEASQNEVSLKNLFLTFGQEKATGTAQVKLTPKFEVFAALDGLPGNTKIEMNAKPEQTETLGKIKISSKNFYKLLKTFAIDVKALEAASMLDVDTQFNVQQDAQKITLDHLNLALNNSSLKGRLAVERQKTDYAADMDLKAENIDNLLKMFDVKTEEKMGSVAVKGTVSGSLDNLKINQKISLLGGNISVDGSIRKPGMNMSYDIILDISHPSLFQAASHVNGTLTKIILSDTKINYKEMQAQGGVNIDLGAARHKITGAFKMVKGNMAALGAAGASIPQNASTQSSSQTSSSSAKGAPWTSDKLSLDALKKLDLDLKLSGEFLQLGKLIIRTPQVDIRILNGKIDIQQNGKLADGELVSTISGSIGDEIKATFSSNLKNAFLNKFGEMFADYKDLDGFLEYSVALTTTGNSTFSLIKNLNGKGNFHTTSAALLGYDFKSFKNSIANLGQGLKISNIDQLFGNIKGPGKRTNIQKCAADLTITNGIFRSNNVELLGEGISGKGIIFMDLPGWNMDSKGQIYFEGFEKAGGIPVFARGSLDDIHYGLQTDQLLRYILQNVLKETLQKKLGVDLEKPEEILKGEKPQKIIKNIIGSILK